jgi:hypothetical protein
MNLKSIKLIDAINFLRHLAWNKTNSFDTRLFGIATLGRNTTRTFRSRH